ncbi:hypothetical protein Aduo_015394 [Ancylostoma duodenale]
MDDNGIHGLILSAHAAKIMLETSKEEYLQEVPDDNTYEARVDFARFSMEKINAASPRVKSIFQYCFDNENYDENKELFNGLEQSDREEFQELRNQWEAKKAELNLKDD